MNSQLRNPRRPNMERLRQLPDSRRQFISASSTTSGINGVNFHQYQSQHGGINSTNTKLTMTPPRSYSEESASISTLVQDHHVVVIRQAEEIRRLRRQLLEVTNERDGLLCEVHHLKMGILATELGRLGEDSMGQSFNFGVEDFDDSTGPSHINMGTCVDDDLDTQAPLESLSRLQLQQHQQQQLSSIYSSSEMTRLSSSSSSSSTSSSPVLFKITSTSSPAQFHHDSSEETGETGVLERRYGGPPARDAALVIQRAYRRYSMVKEFQRIKTERRLSRRINSTGGPTTPGGGAPNGYSICVDLENGSQEPQEEEFCVGDEEEDSIHSGELSRSPCPDLGDNSDALECPDQLKRYTSPNGHHHQQPWSPQLQHPNHSSTQGTPMGSRSHMGQGSPASADHSSLLTSSRLPPVANGPQYCGIPLQHLHAYHQQQLNASQSQPAGNTQYFHHPQHIYAPSSISHVSTTNPTVLSSKYPPKGSPLGPSPNNSMSSSSPVLVSSNGSSPGSNKIQHQGSMTLQHQGSVTSQQGNTLPRQLSDAECEIIRKRLYRVGLNLFNKKPEVGISYLVKKKFLEGTSSAVARFLISRKGLSKQMIGEYLANLQSPFSLACLEHFANEIDLSSLPIDLSLRRFQSFLRMPGEAQKIERIMETFSRRYAVCNPHIISQFRNGADTVFVLAFAIIMLNTDLHTPHLKQDRRMKMEDFIKNLRGIDDGGDIDRDILVSIYERIKQTEFRTGSDHVTQVMKVQQTIVGKKPNLALPHRRLVCYCRLYEVGDINKKEKSGSHQREVFLFNDILVLTKIFHKKRNSVTYSFRQSYPLAGISLLLFTNQYYDFGMCLKRGDTVLLNLNARNEHDRAKFAEDLREAIAESDEMIRIEVMSKENRDSGVDVGKLKRLSNSLLDITDQLGKPVRRGSCGSLDSGMSISFHSDELHQQQLSQQQSASSQSSCLTTTHPPTMAHHQHQGSSCSNSSTSTSHSK